MKRTNFPGRMKLKRQQALKSLRLRMTMPDNVLIETAKRFRGKTDVTAEDVNKYRQFMASHAKLLEERINRDA